MSFAKIGRQGLLIFVGLLPWSVLMSVFGGEHLGYGFFRFWKELFLLFLLVVFCIDQIKKRRIFSWDILDLTIVIYILWMVFISAVNHAHVAAYVYGLRYDAEFLITFIFLRRAIPAWNISITSLARVFLISGGLMLTMSILIRYIFGETFLTIFGFSGLIGSTDVGGPPPIYHDIDGSSIVRFQGVLEGPNQMAFFLVVYSAMYATLLMKLPKYRVINTVALIGLGFLFLETYSRSAYIGIFIGFISTVVLGVVSLIKKGKYNHMFIHFFKKAFVPAVLLILIFTGVLFQFRGQFYSIFDRHGSTSGHYERMMIGFTRFLEAPMGSGLSQAGPASRGVTLVTDRPVVSEITDPRMKALTLQLKNKNPDFYFSTSNYYIPESWYVQQLVEGGVIGFLLFVTLLFSILARLPRYQYFFGAFFAVMLMNIFLHSFESVHTVLALFVFLAALLPIKKSQITFQKFLKYIFGIFIFLLPWHALVVTFMQCRMHLDITFVRFWKEIFVGVFFLITASIIWFYEKRNILTWYKTKPILFWVGLFLLSSGFYMFVPHFQIEPQAFLGFRYDVFFLLALIIGMHFPGIIEYNRFFLKVLFVSTALMLGIFLVWYSFFDIATTTTFFGFSSAVSTFHPESCLAFAQNVAGHHRLQATFGGPIRFSVFVVITYILSLGFIATTSWSRGFKIFTVGLISFVVFVAVFYSYSKTSYIGLVSGLIIYSVLSARFLATKKSFKKYMIIPGIILLLVMTGIIYSKRDLFLHSGSTGVREDNLTKTVTMFLQKPFGYGLGTAGPASQIQGSGNGIDFIEAKTDFLPENWYLQILIEQGIVGFLLFIMVLAVLGRSLWRILLVEKDAYSVAIFSAFCTLLLMGFFTHVFEEAATSYIFFFLVGIHLTYHHKKILGK